MDPRDPKHPLNRRLGDIPAEKYGQPPGLLGAPDREAYIEDHPSATGGYPEMPPPPPLPVGVPLAQVENYVRMVAQAVLGVLNDRHLEDLIATKTTSWAKQAWRPVHQPPYRAWPFRATPLGQISGWAGTSVPSTAAAWTTIASDTVPKGRFGVIKWIANAVGAVADWPNLTWRLVHGPSSTNVTPYPQPWLNFAHQVGQIEAPSEVEGIIVPEGEFVALQAQQASGAPITGVMGMIRGWSWPRTGGVSDGSLGQIVS